MARLSAFLEIPWRDCLLEQTILGLRAEPNSSFTNGGRKTFEPHGQADRALLSIASHTQRRLLRTV